MDMPNWPAPSKGNVQEFFATGGVWQTWTKPRGVDMIFMFIVGSGASGGGGFTNTAGNPRGGGGGGGAGGCARLIIPAVLIPETLYVRVGVGGASVGAGTLGSSGEATLIGTQPTTNGVNQFLASSSGIPGGGAAGTAAGSNAGGAAATASVANNMSLVSLAMFQSIGGGIGSASGAISGANGAPGVATAWMASNSVCVGGGGGATVGSNNTDSAGGALTTSGVNLYPAIAGGLAGGGAGNPGMFFTRPFRTGPGTGGGSFGTGVGVVGGRGGDGAIGSGGGGGGGGVTGGAGGRGGDGYALILSW